MNVSQLAISSFAKFILGGTIFNRILGIELAVAYLKKAAAK